MNPQLTEVILMKTMQLKMQLEKKKDSESKGQRIEYSCLNR